EHSSPCFEISEILKFDLRVFLYTLRRFVASHVQGSLFQSGSIYEMTFPIEAFVEQTFFQASLDVCQSPWLCSRGLLLVRAMPLLSSICGLDAVASQCCLPLGDTSSAGWTL